MQCPSDRVPLCSLPRNADHPTVIAEGRAAGIPAFAPAGPTHMRITGWNPMSLASAFRQIWTSSWNTDKMMRGVHLFDVKKPPTNDVEKAVPEAEWQQQSATCQQQPKEPRPRV